jgi:hypothetical protein
LGLLELKVNTLSTIYSLFKTLEKERPTQPDSYRFVNIPGVKNHKLGISSVGNPIFFLQSETNNNSNYTPYNLTGIAVDFNQDCKIRNKNKIIQGKYTIVTLKRDSDNLLSYFLDVVFLVVKSLPPKVSAKTLKSEIDKLIALFSNYLSNGSGEIQGLWAELLVIEQSKKPDYLISSWHITKTDLFDFNDGADKLEIKSTKRQDRIHTFSVNQLATNKNSGLIISSVLVTKSGLGKNIFDLVARIEKKLKDKQLMLKVGALISETLGSGIHDASEIYFDYNSARDNIAFYNASDIPKLDPNRIPIEITNIHFDCNLSKVKIVDRNKMKSKLYKAL